jgi:MFS family permease
MKYFLNFSLLFRNRNYGLLYLGQFVSFIGTMITGVALPYQIYTETHSTLMVGLIGFFQLLPLLFTALLGGVFADRYQRRRLLLITESLLAVGALMLVLNAGTTAPHIWLVFLLASIMSTINGLHRPALDSITQQIVDKKDYPTVGGLSGFKFSIGMIAGPAVGGLLISHYGLVTAYAVDASTFIISLLALLCMSHIPSPATAKDESAWSSVKSGFRYAASRQELIGTYLVDFLAMIFGMPTALLPAIALTKYHDVKVLGLLYSAPAVGALFISFFSGLARKVSYHGRAVAIASILWGVAMVGFGLSPSLYLGLFFLALAGLFDAVSGVFRGIMWNETIPQHFRGRLAGIEMISYLSGPRLGDTEAGLVAAMFGVTASVVSGGVLCVISVAISCYYLPRFWHYRKEAQVSGTEPTPQ